MSCKKIMYFTITLALILNSGTLPSACAHTTVFDLGEVLVSTDEKDQDKLNISEKKRIGQKALKTHKVVDLAEILSDELIEAYMIRKSGYGNEVGLRGFTCANLRYTQDNTLIEGSCGSRKDPPLSHINMLNVGKIEVKEGPYDVATPGALGGSVNVVTKDTRDGLHGEVLSKFGSYGFLSQGGYLNGGNKDIQGLFGYNYSRMGQYRDGAGNKLTSFNPNYNEKGQNMRAFEKSDYWTKVAIRPMEGQKLVMEASYGDGTDILTPRVAMDTETEHTYLNKAAYTLSNLSSFSDELELSGYYNLIQHYPYGKFRIGAVHQRRIEAISYIAGAKLENRKQSDIALFKYGIDFYNRNWDGAVYNRFTGATLNSRLFPNVEELDFGAYISGEKDIGKLSIEAGLRGDIYYTRAGDTLQFSSAVTDKKRRVDIFPSADIFLKYFFTDDINAFAGTGLSAREPTAVERYIQDSASYYGNPNLKPCHNFETDFGLEADLFKMLHGKIKGFYSYLTDYIYQQQVNNVRSYTNIDAYIAGMDVTGSVRFGKGFSVEGGTAFQYGGKYSQPPSNNNKYLAEVSPLKAKLAAVYDHNGIFATFEWIHSNAYTRYDSAAGEVYIKSWDAVNFRTTYNVGEAAKKYPILQGMSLHFGIDNIFDAKYAVANSYEFDPTDPTGRNVRIVNEPGRFIYGSFSFVF
ncbi:MAG: hypothetical protein JXB40_01685 [Candidatus Omnitrophica bacterium]|nr:hypothetical protein [Candidatus Omnitrophota bacterium]